MCGRFALAENLSRINEIFGAGGSPQYAANYNIAPTSNILMVAIGKDCERKIVKTRWGLVPEWMEVDSKNNVLFNARCETLSQRSAFKNAFAKRRCIIPADGFYEWAREGNVRTPYFVSRNDKMPLAFAGLWEMKRVPQGEILLSASIITTASSENFSTIHNRFPVTLMEKDWNLWLDKDADTKELQGLFHAPDDAILHVNKVSSDINKINNNYPTLWNDVV